MTEAEINCNVHRHVAASFNYHTFLPHLILGYKYMKDPAACYWALHLASIFWAFIHPFKLTISVNDSADLKKKIPARLDGFKVETNMTGPITVLLK